MCKIGSSSVAIANVERQVLSGVPFWEEGDDELLESGCESDEDHFHEEGHKPRKNKLAMQIVDKI